MNTGRGFAFVTFNNEDASKAILLSRFHTVRGQQIEVKQTREQGVHHPDSVNHCEISKYFMGGIHPRCTSQDIRAHFSTLGISIDKAQVMTKEGKSRGFAFVYFRNQEDANKIANHEHWIMGREVEIRKATKKNRKEDVRERARKTLDIDQPHLHNPNNPFTVPIAKGPLSDRKLLLEGLDPLLDEMELASFMGQYGYVQEVKIVSVGSSDGRVKGHVTMMRDEDASMIMEQEPICMLRRKVKVSYVDNTELNGYFEYSKGKKSESWVEEIPKYEGTEEEVGRRHEEDNKRQLDWLLEDLNKMHPRARVSNEFFEAYVRIIMGRSRGRMLELKRQVGELERKFKELEDVKREMTEGKNGAC
ncbi:hypothetical protein TrCOL_g5228 [Triparma columacea]|uniref:RRM domain-containing protein n=1 Tax=Triparma columacea TaxID=722753 RepID=A0A9W7G443_9STRA|nr:hypothetical protein TrCOL_g5228 [Triparma columacea]